MRRIGRAVLVAIALLAAACGDGSPENSSARQVTVFAAASLTDVFTELGDAFEAAHPGVTISFNFAGSSALAQQIIDGAPADVFVSADETNMAKVVDAGQAAEPKVTAHNRLAILVEPGNPKQIRGLGDLARSDVVFVLCAPEVPCGKFGAAALAKAGVSASPASLEENVKAVVSKVTLGEADAGIVYVTDVQAAADDADGVDIDIAADPDLEAVYPMAVTTDAANADDARAWVAFVLSDDGQQILGRYGFLSP